MGLSELPGLVRQLTRRAAAEASADLPDRLLIERLRAARDEPAFEAILRRHGAMVYQVCRRVLRHEQDAEDAFQATFLVLAQQVRSLRNPASLASWLHGVAHRVALRAKRLARGACERQARTPEACEPEEEARTEWRSVLDAELDRLPERWRLPLVLCYLDGRTQDEAAGQLGWSKNTLRRRLGEAKAALGRRLSRRGVTGPAVLSAVLLSQRASAAPSPALVASTLAAARVTGGPAAAAVSGPVAELAKGAVQAMALSKVRSLLLAALVLVGLALGAAFAAHNVLAGRPGGDVSRAGGGPPAAGDKHADVKGGKPAEPPMAGKTAPAGKPADREQPKIDVIGAGETAMELVRTTKDPDAKWMAIRIVGNLRYERAVPLLLESLSDPHHYVRANAARALGDMKVAAAAKPLTELLQKEKDGGVIQQTSLALANLGCADALAALKGAAKHEDVQTRMWVLQAVGRLGGKREVPFLAGYLDDPSQSARVSAAQAIEQITGADFGFPKRSGPSSPEEGLKRADAWWAEHKGEYERR